VVFESTGITEIVDDLEEKAQRASTIDKLEISLENNRKAMIEAKSNGEISDVGAIYLESEIISAELLKMKALQSLKKRVTLSLKIELSFGWNLLPYDTWVNVSQI